MNRFISFSFFILFIHLNGSSQNNFSQIDTIEKALTELVVISSFQEIYPYDTRSENFYFYDFKEFEVLFYDCGYAFFTEKYQGARPKAFFDLLETNPANKEIRPGSMLKFVNIVLKNDKNIMKGRPFVVKIIEEYVDPSLEIQDDYDQEYWDNYWDNYINSDTTDNE